jgi:hypothetical protein
MGLECSTVQYYLRPATHVRRKYKKIKNKKYTHRNAEKDTISTHNLVAMLPLLDGQNPISAKVSWWRILNSI